MPTLIGGDRDRLHVVWQGCSDDFLHRAVMAEMNDFGARGLQHPAHDVDGGIVAVEQGRCRHESNLVRGLVGAWLGGDGYGAHRITPILEKLRTETMPKSLAKLARICNIWRPQQQLAASTRAPVRGALL